MIITKCEIPIRDVVEDYWDDAEEGVTGYFGRLDIRPPYQREFVYKPAQRDEVIRTVMAGFPLNVMYWAKTGADEDGEDTFEVLDGQQRTVSICRYIDGEFSVVTGISTTSQRMSGSASSPTGSMSTSARESHPRS